MSEITKIDLIALRLHKGWSKSEIARQLGIARNAYAGYEEGNQRIPPVIGLACMCLLRGLPPYRKDILDIMVEGDTDEKDGKKRRVDANRVLKARKTGRPYRSKRMHPRDAVAPLAAPDMGS